MWAFFSLTVVVLLLFSHIDGILAILEHHQGPQIKGNVFYY
jgi:hypothetical protein